MTNKEQELYKQCLIAFCKRLNAAFLELDEGAYMTIKYYDKYAPTAYKKYQYQKKLGITFNGLKEMAGIPIDSKRIRKPQIKRKVVAKQKGEVRICNMCGNEFPKFENTYSCPACARKKGTSSDYTAGFDEMEIGYL